MKKRWLKAIYLLYKPFFYQFFVEEFLYDVPTDIREPAMSFLSQGRERLEKWGLFQVHVIQSRLETDPKKIEMYRGMILLIKLLLINVETPQKPLDVSPPPPKEKRDDIGEASAAVAELKKLSTPKN